MNVALRPNSINLISLCTGGGGLDLGVELAMPSARSVVLVEREAFAVSQLVSAIQQGLMAEAAIWSDVTTFDGRPWRGIVDGVIGGIPCQPHSLAGKRQGSDDERDLWSDARRIIVQSGAWFVLIENVSGMLSAKPGLDPGALRVRRDLQRLGFDVEGGLFTAAEVGASHERERVFILAVADARQRSIWRRPRSGSVLCAAGDCEGEGYQRERHGDAVDGRGVVMADTERQRATTRFPAAAGGHGVGPEPAIAEYDRRALVDATSERRGEGRTESIVHDWFDSSSPGAGGAMAPAGLADTAGPGRRPERPQRGSVEGWRSGSPRRLQPRRLDGEIRDRGLFPPGPSDVDGWRHTLERAPELEPAFRRVADGLASRLDVARVDRLRLLGNGVVSLEAAYAVRTLATRLAASGSAGAARLVRMMAISATKALEAAE